MGIVDELLNASISPPCIRCRNPIARLKFFSLRNLVSSVDVMRITLLGVAQMEDRAIVYLRTAERESYCLGNGYFVRAMAVPMIDAITSMVLIVVVSGSLPSIVPDVSIHPMSSLS